MSIGGTSLTEVTSKSDPTSLLRFLQDRLREETPLIIDNTPIFGIPEQDPEFESRFLERRALVRKQRTTLAIITLTVESMQAEQGMPPASAETFVPGPVTNLGTDLLKLIAALYEDHPDYQRDWRPDVQLPMAE